MEEAEAKIVLGIDPGTNIMGYGVIKIIGNQQSLLAYDAIPLSKERTPFGKLKAIFDETLNLIKQHKPNEVALEAPFYGNNVQSMLKLGRAQGASMSAALHYDLPISEYAPRKVKQSITGNGHASKEQVAGMVSNLLNLDELPAYLDATDGLAVAICHQFQQIPGKNKAASNYSSWKSFIKDNPDKME